MTSEEYNKTQVVLAEFPGWEDKYNKSALFHQVVQMLVRVDNPYKVIEQLIAANEDLQKAFQNYIFSDNRPTTFRP